jgi:hypothetical protein
MGGRKLGKIMIALEYLKFEALLKPRHLVVLCNGKPYRQWEISHY